MPILEGAIAGLVAGAIYGFSGFWKAKGIDKAAVFNFKSFLVSIIPSTIIGGALGMLSIPTDAGNIGIYLDGSAGVALSAILKKLFRV